MAIRDMPDIYVSAPRPTAPGLGHIYQANPSCPCYNFYITPPVRYPKIYLNLMQLAWLVYIEVDVHYDYGIVMTFIYAVHHII